MSIQPVPAAMAELETGERTMKDYNEEQEISSREDVDLADNMDVEDAEEKAEEEGQEITAMKNLTINEETDKKKVDETDEETDEDTDDEIDEDMDVEANEEKVGKTDEEILEEFLEVIEDDFHDAEQIWELDLDDSNRGKICTVLMNILQTNPRVQWLTTLQGLIHFHLIALRFSPPWGQNLAMDDLQDVMKENDLYLTPTQLYLVFEKTMTLDPPETTPIRQFCVALVYYQAFGLEENDENSLGENEIKEYMEMVPFAKLYRKHCKLFGHMPAAELDPRCGGALGGVGDNCHFHYHGEKDGETSRCYTMRYDTVVGPDLEWETSVNDADMMLTDMEDADTEDTDMEDAEMEDAEMEDAEMSEWEDEQEDVDEMLDIGEYLRSFNVEPKTRAQTKRARDEEAEDASAKKACVMVKRVRFVDDGVGDDENSRQDGDLAQALANRMGPK